MTLKVIIVKKT